MTRSTNELLVDEAADELELGGVLFLALIMFTALTGLVSLSEFW